MKTIEDKAKAYDKVLERAKEKYPTCYSPALLEYIFPELKESEDEKIRKWIIDDMRYNMNNEPLSNSEYIKQAKKAIAWLEKQGEQKSTDKAEPKFHEGDWVVSPDNLVFKITHANSRSYTLHLYNNDYCIFETERWYIDKKYHLWTITDARDGDVLSDGTTIFIFKDLLSDGSVTSYCDYCTDSGESDAFCSLSVNLICSKITPTTKKQRDLLFSKIKESGWEWDSEKKELKKLGQSEVTKISDKEIGIAEIPFGAKDSELQEATYYIPKGFHAEIDNDKVVIKKGE